MREETLKLIKDFIGEVKYKRSTNDIVGENIILEMYVTSIKPNQDEIGEFIAEAINDKLKSIKF